MTRAGCVEISRRPICFPISWPNKSAASAGAYEGLFVEPDGTVNEGTSANVAAVLRGTIVTPPHSHRILPGVSRDIVVELARRQGLVVDERPLLRSELLNADEVFLTGTTTEVQGVIRVDDTQIGSGQVGPITWRLYEAYVKAAGELLEAAGEAARSVGAHYASTTFPRSSDSRPA